MYSFPRTLLCHHIYTTIHPYIVRVQKHIILICAVLDMGQIKSGMRCTSSIFACVQLPTDAAVPSYLHYNSPIYCQSSETYYLDPCSSLHGSNKIRNEVHIKHICLCTASHRHCHAFISTLKITYVLSEFRSILSPCMPYCASVKYMHNPIYTVYSHYLHQY